MKRIPWKLPEHIRYHLLQKVLVVYRAPLCWISEFEINRMRPITKITRKYSPQYLIVQMVYFKILMDATVAPKGIQDVRKFCDTCATCFWGKTPNHPELLFYGLRSHLNHLIFTKVPFRKYKVHYFDFNSLWDTGLWILG